MNIGDMIRAPFMVRESGLRTTKTGKPFCSMKLWSGVRELGVNLWDFVGSVPEVGDVLMIEGLITEWSGMKQIDVKVWRRASTDDLIPSDYFLVRGDVNVDREMAEYLRLAQDIGHAALRDLVLAFYKRYESALRLAPAAKSMHHAYAGGLVQHLVGVCTKALALGGSTWDRDVIAAGALLHDIGKIETYIISEDISISAPGILMDHIPIGICMLERLGVSVDGRVRSLIYNIVLSHHGRLEYGSPVLPRFGEAFIVHCADLADSKLQPILEHKGEGTFKCWPDGELFSIEYVRRVMHGV